MNSLPILVATAKTSTCWWVWGIPLIAVVAILSYAAGEKNGQKKALSAEIEKTLAKQAIWVGPAIRYVGLLGSLAVLYGCIAQRLITQFIWPWLCMTASISISTDTLRWDLVVISVALIVATTTILGLATRALFTLFGE